MPLADYNSLVNYINFSGLLTSGVFRKLIPFLHDFPAFLEKVQHIRVLYVWPLPPQLFTCISNRSAVHSPIYNFLDGRLGLGPQTMMGNNGNLPQMYWPFASKLPAKLSGIWDSEFRRKWTRQFQWPFPPSDHLEQVASWTVAEGHFH